MDNETDITEETVPTPTEISEPVPDTPTQTKPKSKKGLMIGIVAVAIVVVLLISFMLMSGTGVEGKWLLEETVAYEPDGSVNSSFPGGNGIWWEFRSDGKVIIGDDSGNFEDTYGDAFNNITWKYVGDTEIEKTLVYYYNETETITDVQVYEYEVDGDTLTLSYSPSHNNLTVIHSFKRA